MGFLGTTLLLTLALGLGSDEPDWEQIWLKLGRLQAMEAGAEGSRSLLEELEQVESTAPEGARRALLGAHLEAWEGSTVSLLPDQVSLEGLSGHESWLLVEVLPTSPQRAEAVLYGLSLTPTLDSHQLDLAWRTAAAEAGALRLESGARPIQSLLHKRYAAAWTAIHLSLSLMRMGDLDALNQVMGQVIAQEEAAGRSSAELWSQWGLAQLGAGNEQRARDYLGFALARGSSNAAIILGRLDLQQGRIAQARANFRPSLLTERPSAWALRGWGASLLPQAQTQPIGSKPSVIQD